jgi:type IV secretion system protein VirB3
MTSDDRRLNVVHQSLVRPILVMGAERNLAWALYATVAGLLLGPDTLPAAVCGILLLLFGQIGLVYLAKIDPQFSQVYLRHWRYRQDYYPARGIIWVPPVSHVGPLVACWIAAALVALWISLLLGHERVVLTVCATGGAYGTWKILTGSPIRPTVPLKASWI